MTAGRCERCDDSGYVESFSGGFWTGEAMRFRHEVCDCPCGDDVRREHAYLIRNSGKRCRCCKRGMVAWRDGAWACPICDLTPSDNPPALAAGTRQSRDVKQARAEGCQSGPAKQGNAQRTIP